MTMMITPATPTTSGRSRGWCRRDGLIQPRRRVSPPYWPEQSRPNRGRRPRPRRMTLLSADPTMVPPNRTMLLRPRRYKCWPS